MNFLRQRHPSATAIHVAADLKAWRVKSATIAKMIERSSAPSTPLWIALTCFYGPEFLCAVLDQPPAWLQPALRDQELEVLRRDARDIQARLDALT